jgi:hypothetical protein
MLAIPSKSVSKTDCWGLQFIEKKARNGLVLELRKELVRKLSCFIYASSARIL